MLELKWYKKSKNEIDSIGEKKGVYIFSTLTDSNLFGVIYVGQSENLRSRIKQHFSDCEENQELKKHLSNTDYEHKISYAYVTTNLDAIEKYLIKHYQPIFNKTDGNGDMTLAVSLPNVVKIHRL